MSKKSWHVAHLSQAIMAGDYREMPRPKGVEWRARVIIPMDEGIVTVEHTRDGLTARLRKQIADDSGWIHTNQELLEPLHDGDLHDECECGGHHQCGPGHLCSLDTGKR